MYRSMLKTVTRLWRAQAAANRTSFITRPANVRGPSKVRLPRWRLSFPRVARPHRQADLEKAVGLLTARWDPAPRGGTHSQNRVFSEVRAHVSPKKGWMLLMGSGASGMGANVWGRHPPNYKNTFESSVRAIDQLHAICLTAVQLVALDLRTADIARDYALDRRRASRACIVITSCRSYLMS